MSRSRRRLRIGIAGYSHPGGSGVIASELARLLAERGHEVHFVSDALPFRCAPTRENLVYHEAPAVFSAASRHSSYTLALAVKIAEIARRCRLQILHLHYAFPHFAAAILARGMLGGRAPALVTTLHGTDVTRAHDDPAVAEVTRYAIRCSDAVTAVSRFLQRTASATFPENKGIDWVPNFVDLRVFARAPCRGRAALADEEELLLMHVSNFRPVKNAIDTVRVLHCVNRERPARLVLIGDGPELPAVWSEAGRLGVQPRVRLLGTCVDVAPLLVCGDVFLLPSSQESFGLAALEALACGVPAVTSEAGGLPEVIETGRSGFVVPIGDCDAMARRVLELAANERTLRQHRLAALERARAFDAERIVPMYEAVYARSLS